ncbi:MAG: DHH family phosphoesterase [Clostridiales bacterium]|nr:DHH family phosphoesterase [Clostridiales bacterium]
MKNQVKLKGQLKSYLRWPIILSCLLVAMTIGIFIVDYKCGFIAALCLICYVIAALVIHSRIKPIIISELVNFALEYGQVQKALLYDLQVPYVVLDDQGKILWANKSFNEMTGERGAAKGIEHLFPEITKEKLPGDGNKSIVPITFNASYYRAELVRIVLTDFSQNNALVDVGEDNVLIAMYLFDETEIRNYIRENQEQRLVCGVIFVDNYEDALNSTEEVRQSLLAALIERKITKYMQSYDAIVTKVEKDRYQFVIQHRYLPQLQSTKFSLLDEVREINIGNEMAVTLCIGIGADAASYAQSAEWAKNAIELALGRGGDQAVVKEREKISYYGGKKKQVEKSTRVRARVKAHALKQLIEGKDQVVVMGHKIGDVDSFGASVGVYRIARALNKKAYVVLNEVTKTVRPLKECFENNSFYDSDMFLNEAQAREIVNLNTALVVVDVNRPSYTECPDLLGGTRSIVILDHHRQSSESIENAVLSYIEPYASSASEMVAEILQYISDGIKLRPEEANAMYAGLMIDTNNFLNKTGVRTFEAAAYLRKNGADVLKIRMMFRDDMETYRVRAEAISKAEIFDHEFAMAECVPGNIETPTVVGAQVANELLNITDVKASFVFTNMKGTVYISARSMEEVNVQLIMEHFGGGGHSAIAGAQLKDISVPEAMAKVKAEVRRMKNEGEI